MSWSIPKACSSTASSPPPTFRTATAGLRCWRPCSAYSPFSGNCSPTAPMKGQSFTAPWPASSPFSRPRSSNDPTGLRASSCCPGAGSSSARSPGSTAAADWPRTGKTSTATRSASSSSLPSALCSESSAILHEVSGRTLRLIPLAPALPSMARRPWSAPRRIAAAWIRPARLLQFPVRWRRRVLRAEL